MWPCGCGSAPAETLPRLSMDLRITTTTTTTTTTNTGGSYPAKQITITESISEALVSKLLYADLKYEIQNFRIIRDNVWLDMLKSADAIGGTGRNTYADRVYGYSGSRSYTFSYDAYNYKYHVEYLSYQDVSGGRIYSGYVDYVGERGGSSDIGKYTISSFKVYNSSNTLIETVTANIESKTCQDGKSCFIVNNNDMLLPNNKSTRIENYIFSWAGSSSGVTTVSGKPDSTITSKLPRYYLSGIGYIDIGASVFSLSGDNNALISANGAGGSSGVLLVLGDKNNGYTYSVVFQANSNSEAVTVVGSAVWTGS